MSEALDVMASLVLEDDRRWGEAAFDFQWEDARAILSQSGPPNHAQTRGRGGAKTSDLAGLNVAVGLTQAPRGSRLFGSAADRDQARLLIESIEGYRARTPELAGAIEIGAYRVTFPRRDVVLDVLAADAPSAWGLRPYFLTVDEIAQWPSTPGPRALWEALTTALPKVKGSRCVVLTSAGDPAHWSRRVFDHAEASPLWRVHEVPGPVPWLAEDRLAEEKRRLPESSFARLHLNLWTAAEDRLVDEDALRACVTLEGALEPRDGRRYVIGLDVGLRKDATVAAVCHLEADTVVLDRMAVWTPRAGQEVQLAAVQAWLEEASKHYFRAPLIFDPYQAAQLAQSVRKTGLTAKEFVFSSASVGKLAVNLHNLLRDRRLALPDDAALLDELRNVRLKETSPGVLRLDHDPDKHDDRAVALALAALELVSRGPSNATSYCSLCGRHECDGLCVFTDTTPLPFERGGRPGKPDKTTSSERYYLIR